MNRPKGAHDNTAKINHRVGVTFGRVYDPIVGRFLSVDPLVGNPLSAQDYNGYSYCVNNPLKYTDPSGYVAAQISDPGSMFDWWTPYQNSKRHGNTATVTEYFNDIDKGKNSWNEEYVVDQNLADYKKDLAVIPGLIRGFTVYHITHYYKQNTTRQGGFIDGFLHPNATTIETALSNIISGGGLFVEGVRGALQDQFAATRCFAQKRLVASSISMAKTTARSLGVLGAVVTGIEGAFDKDGLTWGDGLKIGVGLATMVSYGWIYGVVDLGVGLTTGTSITDRLGNGLDNALRE